MLLGWAAGAMVFFRRPLFTGFHSITGDSGDTRLIIYLHEHWVQVFRGLAAWRDPAFFYGISVQEPAVIDSLLAAFGRTWAGTTPAEFEAQVREWMAVVKQPKLGVSYLDLVYKPMLELFELLRVNEFRIFVCSGGGRDFMRVFAEETWGVYKENVIGSSAEYTYADGGIVREKGLLGRLNLGPGKPEHIFAQTGRLPIFAGGNADVDNEMLECAQFALLIKHDDADREFAYTASAEVSMAMAADLGWTVVSMKDDWSIVYGKLADL